MIARVQRWVARDSAWTAAANRWGHGRWVRAYFATISRLGDGLFWYALMALIVIADGYRGLTASAHMAATGVVALALYKTLKRWTKRPRPCAREPQVHALVAPLDEFSFPSGHTLHALSFTLVALAYYPTLIWLLAPFCVSVALSRVVLGLHYPSDVLAASVIATALAALSLWLVPGVSMF
ncbi:MAG: phosphatase PAP2 family protein [Lysobacterales bacterium CG17_big_fil_post_rev_8_21_14_2_50_64_11]|nr:MAG: phosphatase PAP2 family protein [Xanthomonadales bacterium CG17_big_fil_post_rev_8_21_14_2_50_64_11]PIX61108.1 MAG: phosphatase PAP2 family protein [Xanthomonadales bacterium CG_4_10_14_3_um_filter_64_11]